MKMRGGCMKLREITSETPLIVELINDLLDKQKVVMVTLTMMPSPGAIEPINFQVAGAEYVKGDTRIEYYDWDYENNTQSTGRYSLQNPEDWTLTKNKRGEWWLHEVD